MPIAITVRLSEDIAEDFRNMAKKEGISQGELLEKLVKEKQQIETDQPNNPAGISEIDQHSGENNQIKLLLKEFNTFQNTYGPTMAYTFNGKAITGLLQPRHFYPFSINTFTAELSSKNSDGLIETKCPIGEDMYEDWYQFYIYKDVDTEEFVIYEYIGLNNILTHHTEINIKRITLVRTLEELSRKIGKYVSTSELEMIEYQLAENISSKNEWFEKYVRR